jgi:ABC-type nickel/cobalt efflux system permease component RcnA
MPRGTLDHSGGHDGHDHGHDGHDAHVHGHDAHVHGHDAHVHGHQAGGDRPVLDRPLSRRGMAGLAVAGGILPSPTAIVVLLATFSAHRVGFGLALILSFSVGMAAALVGVGAVALRARTAVARRLSGRVVWALPIVTAFVIVGVGAYLAIKGAGGI